MIAAAALAAMCLTALIGVVVVVVVVLMPRLERSQKRQPDYWSGPTATATATATAPPALPEIADKNEQSARIAALPWAKSAGWVDDAIRFNLLAISAASGQSTGHVAAAIASYDTYPAGLSDNAAVSTIGEEFDSARANKSSLDLRRWNPRDLLGAALSTEYANAMILRSRMDDTCRLPRKARYDDHKLLASALGTTINNLHVMYESHSSGKKHACRD